MEEIEELQKEESLDSSKLSIQSEIEGQKRCLEILNGNSNVLKDFEEGGGFKDIKILGEQKKPEFIQFVNNKKTTNKATAISQFPEAGARVLKGSVVEINFNKLTKPVD